MPYTPPSGDNLLFELELYTPPSGDNLLFELSNHIQNNILSDAAIKATGIQDIILSDANILAGGIAFINSDAKIKISNIQESILSDAELIDQIRQNIYSDSKIKSLDNNQTIFSNSLISILSTFDIGNKVNFSVRILKNINNKINSVIRVLTNVNNIVAFCKGKIYDVLNDVRTKGLGQHDVINDVRFIRSWQKTANAGFQSLGKTYVKVYINSIEQTDVDVDSIRINKIINGEHTASFELGRAYDSTKPLVESDVEIKYHIWTLYKGYLTSITPSDSPESMTINCSDEYWKKNRNNAYIKVGHKPTDSKELYYPTISSAIGTYFGWIHGIPMGQFVPETIDLFGMGGSDALSQLVQESGNFGLYYDINKNKKLWIAGQGDIVNIERQSIGTNLGLYQLINHKITEDASNIVNCGRVQMGERIIRTFNNTGGKRKYEAYQYQMRSVWLTPAWDRVTPFEDLLKPFNFDDPFNTNPTIDYETLAKNSSTGYGWGNIRPGDENIARDVFRKYKLSDLTKTSIYEESYNNKFLPKVYVAWNSAVSIWSSSISSGKVKGYILPAFGFKGMEGTISEGFSVDYETGIVTFDEPIYNEIITNENIYEHNIIKIAKGELKDISVPQLIVYICVQTYYPDTATESENPETTISNPMMFFTGKLGSYPTAILKGFELTSLNIQQGYSYYDDKGVYHLVPSWNDTNYAYDYVMWQLSKTCDEKIKGNLNITLDAACFFNLDLNKRIMINGVLDSPVNILSINYDLSNFVVTLEIENSRYYRRSYSIPSHGE